MLNVEVKTVQERALALPESGVTAQLLEMIAALARFAALTEIAMCMTILRIMIVIMAYVAMEKKYAHLFLVVSIPIVADVMMVMNAQ